MMALQFKRKLACALLAGVIVAAFFHIAGRYCSLAIAQQDCLPQKVWLIERGAVPKKGEYVYFSGTDIPRFGEKVRVVKAVSGEAGDIVEVTHDGWGEARRFTVAGALREYRVRAHFRLLDGRDGKVLREGDIFAKGSDGRELPFLYEEGVTRIDRGFFVTGTHPAAYDSRYWGTIDERAILGRAHPIF
jgi:hypothetical protein